MQNVLFALEDLITDDGDKHDAERRLVRLHEVDWRAVGARLQGRQRDVARLYALGYTVESIAAQLELSPHTVRVHLTHANEKLLVHLVAADPCTQQNAVVFGVQAARCGIV